MHHDQLFGIIANVDCTFPYFQDWVCNLNSWLQPNDIWQSAVIGAILVALFWRFVKLLPWLAKLFSETKCYDIYFATHVEKITRFVHGPRIQLIPYGPIDTGPPEFRFSLLQVILVNKAIHLSKYLPTKPLDNAKIILGFFDKNKRPLFDEMLLESNLCLASDASKPVNIAGRSNNGHFFIYGLGLSTLSKTLGILIPDHQGILTGYPIGFSPPSLPCGEYLVCIKLVYSHTETSHWFSLRCQSDPHLFIIKEY